MASLHHPMPPHVMAFLKGTSYDVQLVLHWLYCITWWFLLSSALRGNIVWHGVSLQPPRRIVLSQTPLRNVKYGITRWRVLSVDSEVPCHPHSPLSPPCSPVTATPTPGIVCQDSSLRSVQLYRVRAGHPTVSLVVLAVLHAITPRNLMNAVFIYSL